MTVLCVGEPLISLTPPSRTSLAVAGGVHLSPAGAELNVALHLARLGVEVAYAGAVGDDPFGTRLRTLLAEAGVDARGLLEGAGPTGIYFKEPGPPARTLYYRSGSAGSEFTLLPDLDQYDLIHVTGVTYAVRGELAITADALRTRPRSWRLSFDVNYRPAMWPADEAGAALLKVARAADFVFVGRGEAEAIWGVRESEDIRALLAPETEVIVKDDAHPVDIWADGRWWASVPPTIEVTDPVGAGDAFAAAYLASRLAMVDPVESAEKGHRLAGEVMSRVGDN